LRRAHRADGRRAGTGGRGRGRPCLLPRPASQRALRALDAQLRRERRGDGSPPRHPGAQPAPRGRVRVQGAPARAPGRAGRGWNGLRPEGRGGSGRGRGLMISPRIVACLDVTGGRVVKGTKFVDLRDQGDPVELAEAYGRDGADEVIFLDISATPEQRAPLL